MKKIVIIGAGEFQNPLILKAKEMGYETHVFAWKSGDIGEETADYFYPVSIVEKEEILEKSREIGPSAVVSIGSDLATLTVNHVARGLGLTCNAPNNDFYSTNKFLMRKAFKDGGVKVPAFVCSDGTEDMDELAKQFQFPVIVKPTDRSGSRGVTKVVDKAGLKEAIDQSIGESFEKKAIVEEEIKGKEYSCECVSFEGEHYFLAFTEKFTTGEPHYIEIGHIEPAVFSAELSDKIKEDIRKALDALEVRYGASHTEFRVDENGNMKIIEIGARMGGDCIGSDLVPASTGNDFMKMVIDSAEGRKPEVQESANRVAFIRFIFNERDKEILEEVEKRDDVVCIRKEIKPITEDAVTDSSKRFGFYIFSCECREVAEEIMNIR